MTSSESQSDMVARKVIMTWLLLSEGPQVVIWFEKFSSLLNPHWLQSALMLDAMA